MLDVEMHFLKDIKKYYSIIGIDIDSIDFGKCNFFQFVCRWIARKF